MPQMPWWAWCLAAVTVMVLVLVYAARSFRRSIRRQFVAHLREAYPTVEVTGEIPGGLAVKSPDGADGQINLDKVYAAVSKLRRGDSPDARREIYAHFTRAIMEPFLAAKAGVDLAKDGERVMARLVRPDFLRQFKGDAGLPHTPVEPLGLVAVYVLDMPDSVQYVTAKQAEELGLDAQGLHRLALSNLARTFPTKALQGVFGERALVSVKAADSYDAARLLVLPSFLKEDERVVALIPDRDTLLLLNHPFGEPGDVVERLAKVPAGGQPLMTRPVIVTSRGFSLIAGA